MFFAHNWPLFILGFFVLGCAIWYAKARKQGRPPAVPGITPDQIAAAEAKEAALAASQPDQNI